MKLNKDKQIDFQSNAVFEGYDAKISEENMHKLWDLLQDPYKNSIGAVVREYVSNSFDSHSEAEFIKNNSLSDIRSEYSIYVNTSDEELQLLKNQLQAFNNDAVYVSIKKDETGWYWATEDFGVGLSPERVKDVFCSYLKSTKEDSNNVIGAFGIGSKSGLSYTDVIFIRSRYNGIESKYMLRKGEKAPRLDIISNEATSERNGTEIKIYIKSYKKYEWATNPEPETDKFKQECRSQLAYFDNVYFDNCEISNDYVIAKGVNWIKSSNGSPYSGLHMCLGKVAYPIDWDTLGVNKIAADLALKFEIGELDIIQTREDVKYTPRTKKAILDKIEAFRDEIINKYNTEHGAETTDLKKYLLEKNSSPSLLYDLPNYSFTINLYDLFRNSTYETLSNETLERFQNIEYKPFKDVNLCLKKAHLHDIFSLGYKVTSYLSESGLKHSTRNVWNLIDHDYCIYRIKEEHQTKKSKYIRSIEGKDVFLLRAKTKKEATLKHYVKLLTLEWDDRANWRTKIKTFQDEIRKFLISKTKSYEAVSVDPDWIKLHYGKAKRTFDTSKILTNRLTEFNFATNSGWVKEKLVKGEIPRKKAKTFIVGTKEDQTLLYFIASLYKNNNKLSINYSTSFLNVLYVAPSNLKYFEDCKNLVTRKNYKMTKPFIRAMTAYHISKAPKYEKINNFLQTFAIVDDNKLSEINPDFTWARGLKEYIYNNSISKSINYREGREFWKISYEYALENDIFEKDIIEKMDYLLEYFDFPMFQFLNRHINVPSLTSYIYLYNKVVPVNKRKRLSSIWLINYREEELSWLSEADREIINKIQFRNGSKN